MSNPVKTNFKTEWFAVALIILGFLAGFYFYRHFPSLVPTHWNFQGEVNGYSRPFTAAFAIPLMMLGLYLIFTFLPYLDPKKEQYANFASVYHHFKDLIIVFLFVLYLMASLSGLGYKINISFWMPLLVGLLFVIIGFLLTKVKTNWFLGVRTPWTMSSEKVWARTHQLSNRVLIAAGLLIAATVLVPALFKTILFILAVALIIFGLPIYSYYLYRQEKKGKKI